MRQFMCNICGRPVGDRHHVTCARWGQVLPSEAPGCIEAAIAEVLPKSHPFDYYGRIRELEAARDAAIAERDARFDCKGGPGTTAPACGGCATCLHRVIASITAERDALKRHTAISNGPCVECKEPTNWAAGDPGEWPVMLPTPLEPSTMKHHHVKCVLKWRETYKFEMGCLDEED